MSESKDFEQHEADIQAIVATGFPRLRECSYWILEIKHRNNALAWLKTWCHTVKSVADLRRDENLMSAIGRTDQALFLAFTHPGLLKLGLEEASDFPFPSAFKFGMADTVRANAFGDKPQDWKWGFGSKEPHLLVAYYAKERHVPAIHPAADVNWTAGFNVIEYLRTCPSYIEQNSGPAFEPFGFRDGIGQPVIDGMRESTRTRRARLKDGERFSDRLVAPGEFLLGHRNEYGEIAQCPDMYPASQSPTARMQKRFGFNGSYLVVRQYWQDVDAFHALELAGMGPNDPTPGEKMIGRRKDGRSLIPCPVGNEDADSFRYRVDDVAGFHCPRGAHIRRANPRDNLGWDVPSGVAASKLHRIIRRGRVWTESCQACALGLPKDCGGESYRLPENPVRCGKGIVFVALNADLERQYEFIQQHWLNNPKFGDLVDERDPILGGGGPFSVPALPVGEKHEVPTLTEVRGGAYFFLPSLEALAFIANLPAS